MQRKLKYAKLTTQILLKAACAPHTLTAFELQAYECILSAHSSGLASVQSQHMVDMEGSVEGGEGEDGEESEGDHPMI